MADPLTADELVGAILDLHLPTLTRQLGAVGVDSGTDGDAFEVTGVRSCDGRFVVLVSPGLADYVEAAEGWRTYLEEHHGLGDCVTVEQADRDRRQDRERIRQLERELAAARDERDRMARDYDALSEEHLRASGP